MIVAEPSQGCEHERALADSTVPGESGAGQIANRNFPIARSIPDHRQGLAEFNAENQLDPAPENCKIGHMRRPEKLPQDVVKPALASMVRHDHGVLRPGDGIRLSRGRVHEVQGESSDVFALIAASGLRGSVFRIGQPADIDSPSPTGLQIFLDLGRLN